MTCSFCGSNKKTREVIDIAGEPDYDADLCDSCIGEWGFK